MVDRNLVEQVFSYFGLVLWSFQMAPQGNSDPIMEVIVKLIFLLIVIKVYKNWKRGSTEGVSPYTMLIWMFSGMLLGNYNIGLRVAVPLIVQPQLFVFICAMCFGQELYYGRGWSKTASWVMYWMSLVVLAGIEVGLTFAYRLAEANGNSRAIEFFGVVPVVSILFGFLPQYWDIFKHRRVEGVSHVFLFMDFFGSLFSTISLAFRPTIDTLSLVNYIGIAVFDVGIVILYYIFQWYNGNTGIKRDGDHDTTKEVAQWDVEANTVADLPAVLKT